MLRELSHARAKRLQRRSLSARAREDLRPTWPVILLRGLAATAGSLRGFRCDSPAGSARDEKKPAVVCTKSDTKRFQFAGISTGATGLEPATSGVTGRSPEQRRTSSSATTRPCATRSPGRSRSGRASGRPQNAPRLHPHRREREGRAAGEARTCHRRRRDPAQPQARPTCTASGAARGRDRRRPCNRPRRPPPPPRRCLAYRCLRGARRERPSPAPSSSEEIAAAIDPIISFVRGGLQALTASPPKTNSS
jgi:hypothetical protein